MATTLTIKGQVTIPKQIRDALDLQPGCKLNFAVNDDGDVLLQRLQRGLKVANEEWLQQNKKRIDLSKSEERQMFNGERKI